MSLGVRGGDELVIAGFEPAAAAGVAGYRRMRFAAREAVAPHAAPAPRRRRLASAEPGAVARRDREPRASPSAARSICTAAEMPVRRRRRRRRRTKTRVRPRARCACARASRGSRPRAAPTVREIIDGAPRIARRPELVRGRAPSIDSGQERGLRVAREPARERASARGDRRRAARRARRRSARSRTAGVARRIDGSEAPRSRFRRTASCSRAISRLRSSSTSKPAGSRGIALAGGRPDFARRDPRRHARHPDAGRARRRLLEVDTGDASDPRRRRRHVCVRARRCAGAGAARATRANSVRRNAAPRRRGRAGATATSRAASASKSSRISPAPSRTRSSRWREGAEGCGLLRTEFLFLDRDHRARRTRAAPLLQRGGADPGRPAARHPHARHRRRQAHSLSTAAARGQSGARPARHPHQPVAARSARSAAARVAARRAGGPGAHPAAR